MKRWLVPLGAGLVGLAAGAVIGFIVRYGWGYEGEAHLYQIDTYEECKAAGYPVQESYPSVCATPDGRSYTDPNTKPQTP